MPVYRYRAVGPSGAVEDGEMDALDEHDVIRRLQAGGHLPISTALKRERFELTFTACLHRRSTKRPRTADVTGFTRELASLLTAGLPLDAALRLLLRHGEGGALHAVIKDVQKQVQAGKRLSSALAAHGPFFDPVYLSLIRAGEASGALDAVLERIARHRNKAEAFRASLAGALIYPATLLVVATVSLLVLMTFVVPRFIPLFEEAEQTLPWLTLVVFSVSEAFARYWWVPIVGILICCLAADRWLARPVNRAYAAHRVLATPLIGELLRQTDTVRLTRTLAMLLRNGLPIISALKLVKNVVRNDAMRAMITRCTDAVQSGTRLSNALAQESMLPRLAVELITIGEESGTLEDMLEKTADTYQVRVEQHLKRLLTLLEPLLILGLGALIGMVIVSILMAMLGLNELVV